MAGAAGTHAVWEGLVGQLDLAVEDGGVGLCRGDQRHARTVRLGGRVRSVRVRRRGQLRRGRVVRGAGVVRWQGGDVRVVVVRLRAAASRCVAAAAPGGDCAQANMVQLRPRVCVRLGRRLLDVHRGMGAAADKHRSPRAHRARPARLRGRAASRGARHVGRGALASACPLERPAAAAQRRGAILLSLAGPPRPRRVLGQARHLQPIQTRSRCPRFT